MQMPELRKGSENYRSTAFGEAGSLAMLVQGEGVGTGSEGREGAKLCNQEGQEDAREPPQECGCVKGMPDTPAALRGMQGGWPEVLARSNEGPHGTER